MNIKHRVVELLDEASTAFQATGLQDGRPLSWWLQLLQKQTDEARAHLASGDESKALAEVADHIAVAWEILDRFTQNPAGCVARRISSRILPRIRDVQAKDNESLGVVA